VMTRVYSGVRVTAKPEATSRNSLVRYVFRNICLLRKFIKTTLKRKGRDKI